MLIGGSNLDHVLFHLPALVPEARFHVGFGHEEASMFLLCHFGGDL